MDLLNQEAFVKIPFKKNKINEIITVLFHYKLYEEYNTIVRSLYSSSIVLDIVVVTFKKEKVWDMMMIFYENNLHEEYRNCFQAILPWWHIYAKRNKSSSKSSNSELFKEENNKRKYDYDQENEGKLCDENHHDSYYDSRHDPYYDPTNRKIFFDKKIKGFAMNFTPPTESKEINYYVKRRGKVIRISSPKTSLSYFVTGRKPNNCNFQSFVEVIDGISYPIGWIYKYDKNYDNIIYKPSRDHYVELVLNLHNKQWTMYWVINDKYCNIPFEYRPIYT